MDKNLQELIERARRVRMSEQETELQRQSFAYGTTKIENDLITREIVARASSDLKAGKKQVVDMSGPIPTGRK